MSFWNNMAQEAMQCNREINKKIQVEHLWIHRETIGTEFSFKKQSQDLKEYI